MLAKLRDVLKISIEQNYGFPLEMVMKKLIRETT